MNHEELIVDENVLKTSEEPPYKDFMNQKEYYSFVFSNYTRHILRV